MLSSYELDSCFKKFRCKILVQLRIGDDNMDAFPPAGTGEKCRFVWPGTVCTLDTLLETVAVTALRAAPVLTRSARYVI